MHHYLFVGALEMFLLPSVKPCPQGSESSPRRFPLSSNLFTPVYLCTVHMSKRSCRLDSASQRMFDYDLTPPPFTPSGRPAGRPQLFLCRPAAAHLSRVSPNVSLPPLAVTQLLRVDGWICVVEGGGLDVSFRLLAESATCTEPH